MTKHEPKAKTAKVTDLNYLNEMMGGKKQLVAEIINASIKQIAEELQIIDQAIKQTDFDEIKRNAHSMKSTASIMGISSLSTLLQTIEELGMEATDIEKIKQLNLQLSEICKQALDEINEEKEKYC